MNEAEVRQLEMANEPAKAMEVCATCGALLVVGDPHQRLDEHISGKQHKGYAQIRSYLEQRRLVEGEQSVVVEDNDLSAVIHKVLLLSVDVYCFREHQRSMLCRALY